MITCLKGSQYFIETKSKGNFTLGLWGNRKISLINFHQRSVDTWLLTTDKPKWREAFIQITGVKPVIKKSIVGQINSSVIANDNYRFFLNTNQLNDVLNYIIQTYN